MLFYWSVGNAKPRERERIDIHCFSVDSPPQLFAVESSASDSMSTTSIPWKHLWQREGVVVELLFSRIVAPAAMTWIDGSVVGRHRRRLWRWNRLPTAARVWTSLNIYLVHPIITSTRALATHTDPIMVQLAIEPNNWDRPAGRRCVGVKLENESDVNPFPSFLFVCFIDWLFILMVGLVLSRRRWCRGRWGSNGWTSPRNSLGFPIDLWHARALLYTLFWFRFHVIGNGIE